MRARTTSAHEHQIQCIDEKQTKPYAEYGAGSIAGENWIWCREANGLRATLVSRWAGA